MRAALARLAVAVLAALSVARADIPPPAGYVETCTAHPDAGAVTASGLRAKRPCPSSPPLPVAG